MKIDHFCDCQTALFRVQPHYLENPDFPLVNLPVNFVRNFEVEDHRKIQNWSCRLQPSIKSVELTSKKPILYVKYCRYLKTQDFFLRFKNFCYP